MTQSPAAGIGGPVIVGVDGSANARRALEVTVSLARASSLRVVAVHALGLLTAVDGRKVSSFEHRDEIEQHLRSDWCSVLADHLGDHWEARLVDGNPAEVLLGLAAAEHASFLVVGARGIGGHPDLMIGSTSHQVIAAADCPVVVVPPPHRRTGSA